MRVVISGATGMVGTALSESLRRDGHVVSRFVRPGKRPAQVMSAGILTLQSSIFLRSKAATLW